MSLITVFIKYRKTKYRTRFFTTANFFCILCTVINILIPLVIVYRSDGIWIKQDSYIEQPDVNFKHEMIMILNMINSDQLMYTNIPELQQSIDPAHIRVPRIKNYELDRNKDNIYDELNMELFVPMKSKDYIVGITLFLLFDYKLQEKVKLRMESLAVISGITPFSSSGLHFMGELRIHQKELLRNSGYDTRFKHCISEMIKKDEKSINSLLLEYLRQNITTRVDGSFYTWIPGKSSNDSFHMKINLLYPPDTINYRPGFWFMIKWAWIQFVSVFIIFYFLIFKLKKIVYENQLLSTIITSSSDNHFEK